MDERASRVPNSARHLLVDKVQELQSGILSVIGKFLIAQHMLNIFNGIKHTAKTEKQKLGDKF